MAKKTKMIIPLHGISTGKVPVRGLYDPIVDKVIGRLGDKKTTRASHVEPGNELSTEALRWLMRREISPSLPASANKWWADMLPVGGPVLGPWATREDALEAEESWLHEHHIPYCRPCADSQDSQ